MNSKVSLLGYSLSAAAIIAGAFIAEIYQFAGCVVAMHGIGLAYYLMTLDEVDELRNDVWNAMKLFELTIRAEMERRIHEEKREEDTERVTVEQAAAEFGRSASETWENVSSAIKTMTDKTEEKK